MSTSALELQGPTPFWCVTLPLFLLPLTGPQCKSLQTGIAWNDASRVGNYRHSCEHHHHLQNWGWKEHNGRDFGFETIGDDSCGVVRKWYFLPLNVTRRCFLFSSMSL
jgi:hypothetical protein